MRFNQVLVRRGTPTWCDSWGHSGSYWGVDGLSEVSMGIAMGTEEFCYHNGERSKLLCFRRHIAERLFKRLCRDLQATSFFPHRFVHVTRELPHPIRLVVPAHKAFRTLVSTYTSVASILDHSCANL